MIRMFMILAAFCAPSTASEYSLSTDGEQFQPRVEMVFGEPGTPAEGDVVWVSAFPIILGGPGKYEFSTARQKEGILLGRLPGDKEERPLAVRIDSHFGDDDQESSAGSMPTRRR